MFKSISVALILIATISISLVNCGGTTSDGAETLPDDTTSITTDIVSNDTLTVKADIEPIWEDASDSLDTAIPDKQGQDFYLFWDRSIPMRGYIHESGSDSMNTLQEINNSIVNEILTAETDHGSIIPKCREVADLMKDIGCQGELSSREFFTASESPINEGIEFMIDGLTSGTITGAVLISDLMTTSKDNLIHGLTALLPSFKERGVKAYFNDGLIHMAVVGVRLNYWCVHDRDRCWFCESCSPPGYRPYTGSLPIRKPLYVLVMGRSASRDDNRQKNLVSTIALKLEASLAELGSEAEDIKSENVTLGALGARTDISWRLPDKRGFKPIVCDPNHGCTCEDRSTYTLTANFREGRVSINENSMELVDNFRDRNDDDEKIEIFTQLREGEENGVELKINCRQVQNIFRSGRSCARENGSCNGDGIIKPELSKMTMILSYEGEGEQNWDEWSSTRESIDTSLRLSAFIEWMRPSQYKATLSPVLPLACCEK